MVGSSWLTSIAVMITLLLALAFQHDTVRITPAAMLARADSVSGQLQAATARSRAADAAAIAFGKSANPTFKVVAENLGAQFNTTGRDGFAGTDGQATLALPLALGGDLGARRAQGAAQAAQARNERSLTGANLHMSVLLAIAAWERERAVLEASAHEVVALENLAAARTARAAQGRDAVSDGALARMEATAAKSRHARQLAMAARANATLAALVGVPEGTAVAVAEVACEVSTGPDRKGSPVDLAVLDSRLEAATAAVALARSMRIPDLVPEVGYRRTAGYSGLLLGFSLELPLFNGGGAQLSAREFERDATAADRLAMVQSLGGEIAGEQRALELLLAGAPPHDSAWRADLRAAVAAEMTRLEVGEGSLFRLFDARRARLASLTEYQAWLLEVRSRRIRLARLGHGELDASLLCLPENQR